MISEAIIEEYVERINDALRIVGDENRGIFSYEKTENGFILKSGSDVLFISDDIDIFFAYVSFWWMWIKRNRLKIS